MRLYNWRTDGFLRDTHFCQFLSPFHAVLQKIANFRFTSPKFDTNTPQKKKKQNKAKQTAEQVGKKHFLFECLREIEKYCSRHISQVFFSDICAISHCAFFLFTLVQNLSRNPPSTVDEVDDVQKSNCLSHLFWHI